jgi:hypothetical protein
MDWFHDVHLPDLTPIYVTPVYAYTAFNSALLDSGF